jgi:predicted nucleic acid-binding protein
VTRRRWVINASPLIFLAQIDALPLLKQLAEEVLVPSSVRDEVLVPKGLKLPIELPDWLSWKRLSEKSANRAGVRGSERGDCS